MLYWVKFFMYHSVKEIIIFSDSHWMTNTISGCWWEFIDFETVYDLHIFQGDESIEGIFHYCNKELQGHYANIMFYTMHNNVV